MPETSALQPLKTKISHGIRLIFSLFGVFGFILIVSVFLATRTSPKMIHQNYDSIEAAAKMRQAWDARAHPSDFGQRSESEWIAQFESALEFSKRNITEPDEQQIVSTIERIWKESRGRGLIVSPATQEIHDAFDKLVQVNEQGLFRLATEAQNLGTRVLYGSLIFFTLLVFFTVAISNNMAGVLANPIKGIAEALASHPRPGERLSLPKATSLELQQLSDEFSALWKRISETDRLNLEQIVAQKNELETILASIEDAVFVLTPTGAVSHCNSKLLELIGLENHEIRGLQWGELPSTHINFKTLNAHLAEAPRDVRAFELQISRQPRHFQFSSRAIQNSAGAFLGRVYLLQDITEQKQRERLKAEFVGVLSHELKTPLQSLSTASDLLFERKPELPQDTILLVDTIHEDVSRIRAVANDFVQISQLDQPSLRLKLEITDLSALLNDWIKPFQVLGRDKDISIHLEKEGSAQIFAKIDQVKFPWVLSNLLSNAIRVSPPHSTIAVLLTDRNGGIELKVSDQGPGIPGEVQSKMYEPFYQGRTKDQDQKKSTAGLLGIGLTVVKEVVEAHEGRVEYHSNQPRGSAFRVLLPFPEIA